MDKTFDSYDEAEEYLSGTTGNYHEYAVRYKEYPEIEPTKTMQELKRRRAEYCARIGALDAPHYAGVKQATVKCKNCGSSLATQFCGKTYMNFCPVCRADLRPESMLEKRAGFEKTIKEIDAKLKAETKKLNAKQESKTKLYWMVCCEVHC